MSAVLYGAPGGATPGDLCVIDPVTGAGTLIGPIGFAVTGLAEDPMTNLLYGYTSNQDPTCPRSFISIDKTTGAGTLIGICDQGNRLTDLCAGSDGTIYGCSSFLGRVHTIDKATGVITVLGGTTPSSLHAISMNSGDVMYGGYAFPDGGSLRTIALPVPVATFVATTAYPADPSTSWAAYAFGPGDILYVALLDAGVATLATLDTTTGVVTAIGSMPTQIDGLTWGTGGSPPPPPGPTRRFFSGYPWRFIVTDLNSETITFLDRLATGRQVTVGRNIAREARGLVPSDNPEVNILHTDGDPFLNEGNRLVYGFRREGWNGSVGPWVCKFAGPLLHLEDNAQTDAPASPWIAQDPWAKLYRVPVRLENGDLPGPDGRVFLAADLWTYQEIVYQLLLDSISYDGTCFIDPTGGTIVAGPVIGADVTLQQGLSVGAAWDQLCATGKTDIELDPVYDPVGRPGICCTFNAKPVIGTTKNAAIFAWDLPSRSLTDISRVIDGTGRANTIQYYFGQGGPPVSLQIDATSKAKYGEYWEQQFWPGFREAGPVTAMAARRLALVKDGVRTFTFAPAPERSPIPFDDYMPGDWAPFFASKKLRAVLQPTLASGQWRNIPRIESFTVDIADNQTETVNPLLVSMDIQP